jgi:hypothetical protein
MKNASSQQARLLLLQRDFTTLLDLCESDRRYWRALRSILNESDDIRWPAIEAAAGLMQRWWQAGHEEKVREYLRKLLWSLNDESGEIGWNAPQTIAEIIARIPALLEPYASIMIARSLEEPPLVNSGLWGIGRLGRPAIEEVALHQSLVLAAFNIDDPETLGLAARAMGEVGFSPAVPCLRALVERTEPVRIYIDGQFCERPLGEWAGEAVSRIGA